MEWREKALDQHPHRAVVTRRWILPNDMITTLSKAHASDIHGPEMVSEIVDHTEEWESTYASDIYRIIAQFDEERRVRKLCACLSRGVAKKVRSIAWQKKVRKRFEGNAEAALIIAEGVLDDIAKSKRVTKKGRKLLVQRRTTSNNMDEVKRRAKACRSKLRWVLEGAVRNLQEQSDFLREFVAWSDDLVGGDGNDEGDEMKDCEEEEEEEDGEEEAGNSRKAAVYLPPPVRRSSRQSI